MKKKAIALVIMLCMLSASALHAQSKREVTESEQPFNTVFANIRSGKYSGTANGVLFFKNPQGKRVVLDFQGSPTELMLRNDPEEVYDVSWKDYTAHTTSGKTKVEYTTYGLGNELKIQYQNQTFQAGILDGACDMVVDGLTCTYVAEQETEYLILQAAKEIKFSNFYFLMDKVNCDASRIDKEITPREQAIYLQPGSVLVLAIRRK